MSLPQFRVGRTHLDVTPPDNLDPRGIVWLYEPPKQNARYIVGVDPTHALGRNWTRYNRDDEDGRIDNGAVEVFRIGRGNPCRGCYFDSKTLSYACSIQKNHFIPDYQVAEYAAPISPEDLAGVVNTLGRIYAGSTEDNQAHCIVEVYPGPGGPCQRTMQERYGYTNLYQFQYLDTGETQRSKVEYGWYSSRQSVQYLWSRGLRLLSRRQVILFSPWLIEELADSRMDLILNRGSAVRGHDDRVTATLLALWAGHNWTFNVEVDSTPAHIGPVVEYQASDISSERMYDAWEERWEELAREAAQDYA